MMLFPLEDHLGFGRNVGELKAPGKTGFESLFLKHTLFLTIPSETKNQFWWHKFNFSDIWS